MSRNLVSLALLTMKALRTSTTSPIRVDDDVVGQRGLLDGDLQQRAQPVFHGGDAQLLGVHLAEALQAPEVLLVVRVVAEEDVLGVVVLEVDLRLAHLGGVQRRLADVDVARARRAASSGGRRT